VEPGVGSGAGSSEKTWRGERGGRAGSRAKWWYATYVGAGVWGGGGRIVPHRLTGPKKAMTKATLSEK